MIRSISILIIIVMNLMDNAFLYSQNNDAKHFGTQAAFFDQELAPFIESFIAKKELPSVAVSIVHYDKLLYAAGFGFANKEDAIQATAHTVYGVGSVSKVVTAAGIMQLVEQGKVDLSKQVKEYIPRFHIRPPIGKVIKAVPDITVHQLLTHTSGLPKEFPPLPPKKLWEPQTLPQVMQSLYESGRLESIPGTIRSYSNIGITIAGRIIERVSEEDFNEYMEKQVLQPLDMKTATFSNEGLPAHIEQLLAQTYSAKGRVTRPPIRGIPAGNLYASALDMSKFMSMMLQGGILGSSRILQASTVNQMFTNQTNIPNKMGKIGGQGIVWALTNPYNIPNVTRIAWHNGLRVGYSTNLYLLPDEGIGVFVVTNIRRKEDNNQMPIVKKAIGAVRKAIAMQK